MFFLSSHILSRTNNDLFSITKKVISSIATFEGIYSSISFSDKRRRDGASDKITICTFFKNSVIEINITKDDIFVSMKCRLTDDESNLKIFNKKDIKRASSHYGLLFRTLLAMDIL